MALARKPQQASRRPAPRMTVRAPVKFVGSGSYLLDSVLGGGWAQGRVVNIVGDTGAGKTLIAVEACANFLPLVRSAADIRYVEAEMAYDEAYGRQIGMPKQIHPIDNIGTVEALFNDLGEFCQVRTGHKTPSLYVVDSLDALSDEAEMQRGISEGSYGAQKARKLSELFRRSIPAISSANCTFLVVSQIRDKLGVRFGETKTRVGGHALGFYSSQTIWLYELGKIPRKVNGVNRVIGTKVRVRNRKNKVGEPFREADMVLRFNYGIDDETSMLDWLDDQKAAPAAELDEIAKQLNSARKSQDRELVQAVNQVLRELVAEKWEAIEASVRPTMSKYE